METEEELERRFAALEPAKAEPAKADRTGSARRPGLQQTDNTHEGASEAPAYGLGTAPSSSASTVGGWNHRKDPTALAFGVGFVFVGGAGLLQSAGLEVGNSGIFPAVLLGLGAAGLWSVFRRASSGQGR